MIKCKTHLVDCLNLSKNPPRAYARSLYNENYLAEYGLDYTNQNFYASNRTFSGQWWFVDFKTDVVITDYQIVSLSQCYWVKTYSIFLSNSTSWENIVNRSEYPNKQIFSTNYSYPIRRFKIEGKDDCDNELAFYYIKFFGFYSPFRKLKNTCAIKRRVFCPFLFMFGIVVCS